MDQKKYAALIAGFDSLPAIARVPIQVVCVVSGRSRASVWRDVTAGRLPQPVKHGHSTRWIVGALREVLSGDAT